MNIGRTLRVGFSLQILRYDKQVKSWQILALRVWHNQAYASSLPEQTKRGREGGHRDKAAAGGWGRRAGVLGGPGMCAGRVTKSSTSTTSHQVQDQTSHHTSNTLSLVSPSFLLSWYKKGECSTLFYQIWFSLHRPIIISSGICLPFSDFSEIADILRKNMVPNKSY